MHHYYLVYRGSKTHNIISEHFAKYIEGTKARWKLIGKLFPESKKKDSGWKLVQGNVCVLPNKCPACNGLGFEFEMFDKRNGIIKGECLLCEGKKFVWPDPVANLP